MHAPPAPWEGPIRASFRFQYRWLKKHKPALRATGCQWKTTRPDNTNLVKQLEDVLEGMRFFLDDSQIAVTHVERVFTDVAGVWVKLEQLTREAK